MRPWTRKRNPLLLRRRTLGTSLTFYRVRLVGSWGWGELGWKFPQITPDLGALWARWWRSAHLVGRQVYTMVRGPRMARAWAAYAGQMHLQRALACYLGPMVLALVQTVLALGQAVLARR